MGLWDARKNHKYLCTTSKGVHIRIKCPRCRKASTDFIIDKTNYVYWKARYISVQILFPNKTTEEKEILITGLCKDCQKEVFEDE